MKRGRDIMSFFTPVNKKGRETNQGIERVEEQEEGESDESVEVEERACDKREGSDTEREIPESEEHKEENEEHKKEGEEHEEVDEKEENIQGQREEQPEGQKVVICGSTTAPSDISKSKNDVPVQPNLKIFPTTLMGDRRRSFRPNWYNLHPWFEYSVMKDSTYCYACRHFSTPNAPDTVFVSTLGFRNWKKATMKNAGFSFSRSLRRHVVTDELGTRLERPIYFE
nr:uncharacterized protein LOC129441456 [Misgurnus anguillicaudatus]